MANRMEFYTQNDDDNGELITGDNRSGQSFTIGTTGDSLNFLPTSFEFKYKTVTDNVVSIVVTIYPTLADGSIDKSSYVACSSSVSFAGASAAAVWGKIALTPGAAGTGVLEKGKKYIVEITRASGDAIYWREDASSPSYTGGTVWETTDSWDTSTAQSGSDKLFSVNGADYEGTLCTLADATNKAGKNANSVSTNPVLVSDFVKQAECRLNAITMYNWHDAYDTLSEDTKYLLNEFVSNLAAIYIITYDFSGYTSRTEAETMINVYRDANLAISSLLKDKNRKTFMVGA